MVNGDTEVLDMSVVEELLSLSDDGDPELLLDLIDMFLDDGPVKVNTITTGVQEHDFDKIERAAHSLKGSSGNLGATTVQNTCEQLQNVARSHELEEATRLSDELCGQFQSAQSALEQLRDSYST